MTKQIKTSSFAVALTALAGEYVLMVEREDRATGMMVPMNQLGFTQQRVIGGVIYTLVLQREQGEKSMEQAVAALKRAVASFRGDEIGTQQIERAQAWVERLEDQQALIEEHIAEGKRVYEAATGETWVSPRDRAQASQARASEAASQNPAVAEALRVLAAHKARAEQPRSAGVEEGHN